MSILPLSEFKQFHEQVRNAILSPDGFNNTNPALAGFTKPESGTALIVWVKMAVSDN